MLKERVSIPPPDKNLRKIGAVARVSVRAVIGGPLSSAMGYAGYNLPLPGLRRIALAINPNLETYFGAHQRSEVSSNLTDAHTVMTAIDYRLYNHGQPQHFIGQELYAQWTQIKAGLEAQLNQQGKLPAAGRLSDYVFFDRERHRYLLFFVTGQQIQPIGVDANWRPGAISLFGLGYSASVETGVDGGVGEELAINRLLSDLNPNWQQNPDRLALRNLNSVSNAYPLVRQFDWEPEGWVISTLRENGVRTIAELQAVIRLLFSEGIHYEVAQKTVLLDAALAARVTKVLRLACPNLSAERAEQEMVQVAQDRVYYHLILASLRQYPDFVGAFMRSPAFKTHEQAFIDRHLAAIGQTHWEIAAAMLAGFYLYQYEGVDSPQSSNSQHFLATVAGYHADIANFLAEFSHKNSAGCPPILGKRADREEIFKAVTNDLGYEKLSALPICQARINEPEKISAITSFDRLYHQAVEQKLRHGTHQVLLSKISQVAGISTDPNCRQGIAPTLIANVAIQRVKDEKRRPYLLSATWLPGNAGYLLRDGAPLPELKRQMSAVNPELELVENGSDRETQNQAIIAKRFYRSLDYILNRGEFTALPSQDQGELDQLLAQEKRIMSEAPVILAYLSLHHDVPENVRQFIGEILSGNLARRILETFGSIADQDPNVIGRFFPEGLHSFVQSVTYRYVFDLIRGIETNLLIQRGLVARIKAQVTDSWHPPDFAQVPQNNFVQAVNQTLADGAHRIAVLNHAVSDIRTLKDLQERAEIIFGWNTEDMKFLRWSKFWTIWHTLGGAWDCICFSRKTVFNPRSFRAS